MQPPYKWKRTIWTLDSIGTWLRLNCANSISGYRWGSEKEALRKNIPAYTVDTKEDAISLLRNIFNIKETYEYTEEELRDNIV